MAKLLVLRLEGVLQSWGTHSRWGSRDTGTFPSKSGVAGLLACALGYPRGDARILDLQCSLSMAVRADKPGKLFTDYHTVTRIGRNLTAATGKERVMGSASAAGEDTIESWRDYLQDACFTVFLSGPEDTLIRCAAALQAPVWTIYLGRKSCVPGAPVFCDLNEDYDSLIDALARFPLRRGASFPCACEMDAPDGPVVRQDVMISTGMLYGSRRLKTIRQRGGE